MPEAVAKEYYEDNGEDVKTPAPFKKDTSRGEELISNPTETESVLDKFSRIKGEVLAFTEELENLAGQPRATPAGGLQGIPVTEMAALDSALGAMGKGELSAFLPMEARSGPPTDSLASSVVSQVACSSDKGAGGVGYDLYYSSSEPSALLNIERRVASLSKIVSSSSAPSPSDSLFARLKDLQARIELMEEYKLDTVLRRTKMLIGDIDTLELPEDEEAPKTAEARAEAEEENAAKVAKINELHALMARLAPTADSVPTLVERLKSQKDTHENAANLLTRLVALEETQRATQVALQSDQAVLSTMTSHFVNNAKVMQGNLELLQKRMDALSKRA
jgi:hypothetical protein